jgi:hypothetical protein
LGSEDPAHLLPQLLDQIIGLGEIARELREALGGNGHRSEKVVEIIGQLNASEGKDGE